MEKLDFKKNYKEYYTARQIPKMVHFGRTSHITLEGKGEPGGVQFTSAVGLLYPVAYAIKKICKLEGRDFGVPPLEGLWWTEDGKPASEIPRNEWLWKLMIRIPDYANIDYLKQAIEEVVKKKNLPDAKKIKWEILSEGKCVQAMHIGPYSTEDETLKKMRQFINENKFKINGLHHEIYLSDPRKVSPEKIKTIIRQPVK